MRNATLNFPKTKVFKVSGNQSGVMVLSVSGGQQLIVLQFPSPAWCCLTSEIMVAFFFKAGVFLFSVYRLKTKMNGVQQYTCEFYFSPKCNKAIQSRRDECCNAG
jgi:hypothetical protein